MKIILALDDIAVADTPDAQDTLAQADFVEKTLLKLGHSVIRLPFTADLSRMRDAISAARADLVFNLVESVLNKGRLSVVATQLFDALNIPYTGNDSFAHGLSADKLAAKKFFLQTGIRTPAGYTVRTADNAPLNKPYILKAAAEHASIGLTQKSVLVPAAAGELKTALLKLRSSQNALAFFAEEYIPGREFNTAFLDGRILPPAEMRFSEHFKGWKILTYEAKWQETTSSYQESARSFDFESSVAGELKKFALSVSRKLDLKGYTRLDFRLSDGGKPYLIDLNTNPCIAPDSGFIAMARKAGLSPENVIERIVADAVVSF